MVVKAVKIADHEFHFGFRIKEYRGLVFKILIGCFDLNKDLIGYGKKIELSLKDWFDYGKYIKHNEQKSYDVEDKIFQNTST